MIKEICASNHIDILWISSKYDLGKAVNKWPIVSAVAVLDYCGAEVCSKTALLLLAMETLDSVHLLMLKQCDLLAYLQLAIWMLPKLGN